MGLGVGSAALVTGAGSGLGRAVSLALAQRGVTVTVVEISEPAGEETVRLIEAEHAKLKDKPQAPAALFVKCDVAIPEQLFTAFAQHERTYGRLDVLLNNAGIIEIGRFWDDVSSNGTGQWRRVLDINLSAVIDGTRLGIQFLKRTSQSGVIINVASASGLYPVDLAPIYAGSKAGVVMFTRSLRSLRREGIRVNTFCPEFIFTNMTNQLPQSYIIGGYIPMDTALKGVFELLEDESRTGDCLWLTKRRGAEYWPTTEEEAKYALPPYLLPSSKSKIKLSAPPAIPAEYRKVVIQKLTSDFRVASNVVTKTLNMPLKPGHVLVKYLYAGVNASDGHQMCNLVCRGQVLLAEVGVNFSAGNYLFPGEAASLPLDVGFEAVGIVAGMGAGVDTDKLMLGAPVAIMGIGCYTEFQEVDQNFVMQVPIAAPEIVAMLISGLTASISLEQSGRMKSGETVMITAAAGGTGQFAVQLAKRAGNKVVATCGGEDKAELLRNLGVDRVINYKKESIESVLSKEFPTGIDLIYESVGGDIFKTCVNALAQHGRIIVIEMISQYQGEKGSEPATYPGLCEQILRKSQTVTGFFLGDHTEFMREHLMRLTELYSDKKLKVAVDPKPFVGVESVADAVEYLHSGRSLGKVVVQLEVDRTSP